MKTVITFFLSGFFWAPVGFAICAILTAGKRADEAAKNVDNPVN